jgi:uncharacterized membrane protein YqgA involved in biofilm formation
LAGGAKNFRLGTRAARWLSLFVIGAFLNAAGILLGGLLGLAWPQPLSLRAQVFVRSGLGAFTVFFGLRLVWENVNGTVFPCLKQLLIAALALVLGSWLGKLCALQKLSNRLGHHAADRLAAAQKNPPGQPTDGFMTGTILFCAAPLGLVGAVTDGLADFYYLLAMKAVMDALATVSFTQIFRWPAALAAFPVYLFLSVLTLVVHFGALPWLAAHALTSAVNATAGLLVCTMSLVIFEVRRVELANYLPALAVAPALTLFTH